MLISVAFCMTQKQFLWSPQPSLLVVVADKLFHVKYRAVTMAR